MAFVSGKKPDKDSRLIMKLRMKNNSVRLRLTQSEVDRFDETGKVEEAIEFGGESREQFVYALESRAETEEIKAKFENNRITVFVPRQIADQWTQTEKVGLENVQTIGDGKTLRLLIEKDYACLAPRTGEDDRDAFPHPSAGNAC